MNNAISTVPEIIPYVKLADTISKRVAPEIEAIRNMNSQQLLTYGIELQKKVTEYASKMLAEKTRGEEGESVETIIDGILDVSKCSAPKNILMRIFRKTKGSSAESKKIFAGKFDALRKNIEIQIGRLIENNIRYETLVVLIRENIEDLTAKIIAISKCIEEMEREDTDPGNSLEYIEQKHLIEQLKRKREMFMTSRMGSIQATVSVKVIQNNNIVLSDCLQTLLITTVPMLGIQVLLKGSIHEMKKGLNILDNVRIDADNTIEELRKK